MINEKQCMRFCHLENLCKIEGYEEAISSPKPYVLHHRAEVQPDGTVCSKKWLTDHHIYYNRDPHELVFMESSEHRRLHREAYWNNAHYAETRSSALSQLKDTMSSDSVRASVSSRSKEMWKTCRESICKAMRESKSTVYKRIYGMTRAAIAKKLGFTEWKVQQLHRKGELIYAFTGI